MASLAKADSRRMHSWLWDSHISPKNSKWLHENLTDMDAKVKAMFKLITEDADSFARKAEMYYKRRPEVIKLIEEFYRAYRALAERYVHATRALKQAHRTMAEAFPNQIPPVADDPPAESVNGEEPRTPEGTPPGDSFFDSVASQRDGHKKNGSLPSDSELTTVRKGLKPVSEVYSPGQVSSKLPGSGVRKELNFDEEFDDVFEKAKKLQEKISKLTSENETLMEQVKSETQNTNKVQDEIQMLQAAQSKLILEKEESLYKFQECLKKVMNLEAELEKFKKINDELLVKANKADSADEICCLLKEENETLQLKVSSLELKSGQQQEELTYKEEELEKLKTSAEDDRLRLLQAEAAFGSLEKLLSEAQEKLKASSLEIQNGVQMLRDMELGKQALEEDISRVQKENDNLNREVKQKEEDLEKLNASLQNELARSMQAEAALQSLEKLHSQSQEELQLLMSDIQGKIHTLKDVESRKVTLEEELANLKEEIRILNKQNSSSQEMIKLLQDEIFSLKEANHKLESEVRLHVEGKETLRKEVHGMKDEMNILQQKHRDMTDQMQSVGLDAESFHTSVKELQDDNLELQQTCKRQQVENTLLLEKLEQMEMISEKNTNLEVSVLDANVEINELREKVNALQISYEALNQQHSVLISEKNILVQKVGSIIENMGKLLENNTFLENSVSDANYELEELRGKMKILEESSQALHNDHSNLQSENNDLLSQVDLVGRSLENLERKYAELHDKHSHLEREKESTQRVLIELSEMSKGEKRDHEDFKQSTNIRLAVLENQINLLHEDSAKKEEKYKEEQFKVLAAQIETFILQQCLCDLKHGNMSLIKEHHKLEKHILGQEGKMLLLLELVGRLRKGMHRVLNALVANKEFEFADAIEESCWQFILSKVKEIQNSILDSEDEKLRLQIENSVNATLIKQLGHELAELKSEKKSIEIDCMKITEDLLFLQTEKCSLLGLNEQLKQKLQAGSKREELLEKEMEILGQQFFELKQVHSISQDENAKMLQECQLLSTELTYLRGEKILLEEENRTLLQELVNVDCLSVIFEQSSAERANELKTLVNELKSSYQINNDLQKKVEQMNEKIQVIEEENFKLKEFVLKSEECKHHLTVSSVEGSIVKDINDDLNHHIGQLNNLIEDGGSLLILKDKELLEAHTMILDLKDKDKQMQSHLEKVMVEADHANSERDVLQQQICSLSSEVTIRDKDVTVADEINKALSMEIMKLNEENKSLKAKDEQWASNLLSEVERCENEVAVLCNDIQEATVRVAVFEDKMHELIGVCEQLEIKNMVERTTLGEEVSMRNVHIEALSGRLSGLEGNTNMLKSELDEYLPAISSLRDGISALEACIIPFEKCDPKDEHSIQGEIGMRRHADDKDSTHQPKELLTTVPEGVLELQRLLARVEALQGVLVQSGGQLVLHNIDSDPEGDPKMQEDEFFVKKSDPQSSMEVVQMSEGGPRKDLVTDSMPSKEEDQLAMKDIQLDKASSSSKFDDDDSPHLIDVNDVCRVDYQNHPPYICHFSDTDIIHTETTGNKSEYPSSELLIERELSIDKLEVPKKERDSQQDWKKEVIEKLKSDLRRLVTLEKNMEELKNKIENSGKSSGPKSFDYDSIKLKLQEADKDILLLADLNKKLTKRAEDCPSFSDSKNVEPEDLTNLRKKVSGRTRRGSEKIGRLELELQKIQYILLKLDEEHESQNNKSPARRTVLLRDYLYGRGGDGKRKKSFFSWCARPKTKET